MLFSIHKILLFLIMKNRTFEVKLYHSGFCVYKVDALCETEALQKAKKMEIDVLELLGNLEDWRDADTVDEIINENSGK